jgi:hypothetical protein
MLTIRLFWSYFFKCNRLPLCWQAFFEKLVNRFEGKRLPMPISTVTGKNHLWNLFEYKNVLDLIVDSNSSLQDKVSAKDSHISSEETHRQTYFF